MSESNFEWNEAKNQENHQKHGVSFYEAQHAFLDKNRIIAKDTTHSQEEERYYCFGLNEDKTGILTVRIRIFGAGYWRKGKKAYEQTNSI
ncbi:MAG: BrnT family toxin [Ectothiorhodospiraceae bacterium]|nr:BrnT family toxin [Ectothiorhodospiraceae bacterium]